MLEGAGKRPPKALKTGTTICGVVYDVSSLFVVARATEPQQGVLHETPRICHAHHGGCRVESS